MTTQSDDEYRQNLLDQIETHGWFSQGVFDAEGDEPEFKYSIGMSKTLGSPEFIIIGLSLNLMHNMLWEVFRQVRDGKPVADGARWSDLLEGFDCISKPVHESHFGSEYFYGIMNFWDREFTPERKEIYQIVWPGPHSGKFPWDHGCSADVLKQQPQLWMPIIAEPRDL